MSEFDSTTNLVNTLLDDHVKATAKLQAELKASMKKIFDAFFKTHPTIQTVYWTQYAPYFNDGDECIFSVHHPVFSTSHFSTIENVYGEDDEGAIVTRYWNSKSGKYVSHDIDPQLLKDMKTLESILTSSTNEGVMKSMFGNHSWVRAHKDGFEVDDCDHE